MLSHFSDFLQEGKMENRRWKCGILVVLSLVLAGCTVNITSNGKDARFELSPARNIDPATSVMNGLSLIPGEWGKKNPGADGGSE